VGGKPAQGADSVLLMSGDGRYRHALPLSAASKKGGLLCVRFENVVPGRSYSLYWQVGGEDVPFFENVPFANIAEHLPGAEKPPARAKPKPRKAAPAAPSDEPEAEQPSEPPTDHPDDWYDRGPWGAR
jgi:hypothetical protein